MESEKKVLRGMSGEGIELAMELLKGVAKLTGAKRFVPIKSAHISGINYANIGDAGLEFLEDISFKAKFSVTTTINPGGIDLDSPSLFGQPEEFIEGQKKIIEAFRRMGAIITLSCIPYEIDNIVPKGSHVAWAESSAVVYANSVLGLRTNRESGITALAAAIAGRTPYSGLHLEENRRPKLNIKVEASLRRPTDYGLLGYWSARLTDGTIGFISKLKPKKEDLKALSAAIGTAGVSGMFVWLAEGSSDVIFKDEDLEDMKRKLSKDKDGEIIFIGCPFVTLSEFRHLAKMLKGRKFFMRAYLFTSRSVYKKAASMGYVGAIEESGMKVVKDVCPALTPIVKYEGIKTVITPSVKASHYLTKRFSSNVVLKGIDEIVNEYTNKRT